MPQASRRSPRQAKAGTANGQRSSARAAARNGRSRRAPARVRKWWELPDEELLELRLCDLDVRIQGTPLEQRIERIWCELSRRHLCFRPHFWLSAEWFTPDGIPGVAIPFYLAHPRLMRLEKRQMLEVEGGTHRWCMKLLRHEVGHAIDNAFRLRRRRKWQQLFGKSSLPYPDYYHPKPNSIRYVLHLDYWYAQSHPTEDFAETFAVWLTPAGQWRKRYGRWPVALQKLEYVDELMHELAGTKPIVHNRAKEEPLRTLKTTLRAHYQEKRRRYGVDYPDFYDRDLRRLFGDPNNNTDSKSNDNNNGDNGAHPARPTRSKNPTAASVLKKLRPQIRGTVAYWTGENQYTIDQVLMDMIVRCKELGLRSDRPLEQLQSDAAVLLCVQVMNYLHGGRHRLAM